MDPLHISLKSGQQSNGGKMLAGQDHKMLATSGL